MSSKSKPSKIQNNLLAAIQRKVPSNLASVPPPQETIAAVTEPEPRSKEARRTAAANVPKSRVGKPVQFWFHDEDRRLVRELAAWLAGQGLRPTDSMVIRATLRTAKTGMELLQAYREASELDGRLKQHKPE